MPDDTHDRRAQHKLTSHVRELAQGQDTMLPRATSEVAGLAAQVDEYLMHMGAV